jgi:hypothetical protein
MTTAMEETNALRELLDRQAIMDCLHRYTRGVDRVDEELIRSAFHPDAVDDHGVVVGSVDDFLAHWLPQQPGREISQHYVSNASIDLDGDTAHVELYYWFVQKLRGEPHITMYGGRYADRFERRETGWRIAARVVIPEWGVQVDAGPTAHLAPLLRGHKDGSDPTYARPLQAPLARL